MAGMLGADPSRDRFTVRQHGRIGGTTARAVVTAHDRATRVLLERLGEAPDLRWREQRDCLTLHFQSPPFRCFDDKRPPVKEEGDQTSIEQSRGASIPSVIVKGPETLKKVAINTVTLVGLDARCAPICGPDQRTRYPPDS